MRTYERTHPWLKFSLDLNQLKYSIWLSVGEAASKTEHIAGVPLSPKAARQLHLIYLTKGVLATTAIEGNTLTEEEVRQYMDGKLKLPISRQYLGKEIDNIIEACNLIGNQTIRGEDRTISPQEIKDYNRLVLRELPLEKDVVPGEFRNNSVMVGRYRGAPVEDCEYLLERFCQWINGLEIPRDHCLAYSILAAIAAHLYFVWIHPFGDGNGRTARLIEFRYLLQAGFPTPAAHLLSNFYNLTRTEYYRQLDNASRSGGIMNDFIAYAVQGLVDQLHEQLNIIRDFQWDTTWKNYVYELFGEGSPSQRRRRRLVLELSKIKDNQGWVNVSGIPEISVRLAGEYSNKTRKTISRDLNALAQMNLIQRERKRVKANKEIILAFLPARAHIDENGTQPAIG
jgi:Fic family protein